MPTEQTCDDRRDDDGDSVTDCGDADCQASPACKPDGRPENTDLRCSDWVDNDDNGAIDCDDMACDAPGITACLGSWDLARLAGGAGQPKSPVAPPSNTNIGGGVSMADLLAAAGDNDGERNDVECSDGVDNDHDGKVDCEDLGCRLAADVVMCQASPDIRFSVVGNIAQIYDLEAETWDTRFSKIQLRAMGPIPRIQDSFFLLSMRAEKTPRLTFAMFQIPLGGGHTLNVNSGGGGLSYGLIVSAAKQLLLDPPYYLYNAFEQGNGAALELAGPVPILRPGLLNYRAFAAGGSGRFAGNVGGRYFREGEEGYTMSAGAQLGLNLVGYVSRWDSPFILRPQPLAVALRVGAKYDQRAVERYPAVNGGLVARWRRLVFMVEDYYKQELDFETTQNAINVTAGFLIWPELFMLAADWGNYRASDFGVDLSTLDKDPPKLRNEDQWRVALHYYFWSNIGLASVVYTDRWLDATETKNSETERELKLVVQYRF